MIELVFFVLVGALIVIGVVAGIRDMRYRLWRIDQDVRDFNHKNPRREK